MTLSGSGIPTGTKVVSVNGGASEVTLDTGVTSAGTGTITGKSPVVTNLVVGSGAFAPGQTINGPGIASNVTLVSCDPNCTTPTSLTLDKPVTEANTGVELQGGPAASSVQIFQPDGTPVGSPIPVSSDGKKVGIDVDPSGNFFYVPDPSAGTVIKYNNNGNVFGTFGPDPGGTPLNDISDVAVDSNGNLYVSDRSTNAQNEQVTFDLHGATAQPASTYQLSFNGATSGYTFTGDVHAATGKGTVNRVTGTADFIQLAGGHGDLTYGSNTITNVSVDSGTFEVGKAISSGVNNSPIPLGTTIVACSPDCGSPTSITISNPAGDSSGPNKPLFSGDNVITNVSNPGAYTVGMGIVGGAAGTSIAVAKDNVYPVNSRITAIDTGSNTLHPLKGCRGGGNRPGDHRHLN